MEVWDDDTNHWQAAKNKCGHVAVLDADRRWLFDNEEGSKVLKLTKQDPYSRKAAKRVFQELMGHEKFYVINVYKISKEA